MIGNKLSEVQDMTFDQGSLEIYPTPETTADMTASTTTIYAPDSKAWKLPHYYLGGLGQEPNKTNLATFESETHNIDDFLLASDPTTPFSLVTPPNQLRLRESALKDSSTCAQPYTCDNANKKPTNAMMWSENEIGMSRTANTSFHFFSHTL